MISIVETKERTKEALRNVVKRNYRGSNDRLELLVYRGNVWLFDRVVGGPLYTERLDKGQERLLIENVVSTIKEEGYKLSVSSKFKLKFGIPKKMVFYKH